MKCPLCQSITIRKIETIKVNDLICLYGKMGIDIDRFFVQEFITYLNCNKCDLRFFDFSGSVDEAFYESLQMHPWYYLDEKAEYKYALQYIGPNDKLLEIGCGKGAFSEYLTTTDYTGLEFSQQAIDIAKKAGIRVILQSIQEHSIEKPGYYDVVCSFQVLEHISAIYDFLNAVVKTIKTGGILILAVPCEDSFLRFAINNALNLPPHHVSRWSDKSLDFLASCFDLELLKIHHEQVQPIHQRLFLATILINSMLKADKAVDCSLKYRLLSKIVSKIIGLFFNKELNNEFLPNGHTVTAVYRKI